MLRHIKLMPIILVLLLIFLQYRLWFDSSGIMAMWRLKKEIAAQTATNDVLKKRNDDLIHEIEHLHTTEEGMESRARSELGMIKKDETFYQVVE